MELSYNSTSILNEDSMSVSSSTYHPACIEAYEALLENYRVKVLSNPTIQESHSNEALDLHERFLACAFTKAALEKLGIGGLEYLRRHDLTMQTNTPYMYFQCATSRDLRYCKTLYSHLLTHFSEENAAALSLQHFWQARLIEIHNIGRKRKEKSLDRWLYIPIAIQLWPQILPKGKKVQDLEVNEKSQVLLQLRICLNDINAKKYVATETKKD